MNLESIFNYAKFERSKKAYDVKKPLGAFNQEL